GDMNAFMMGIGQTDTEQRYTSLKEKLIKQIHGFAEDSEQLSETSLEKQLHTNIKKVEDEQILSCTPINESGAGAVAQAMFNKDLEKAFTDMYSPYDMLSHK